MVLSSSVSFREEIFRSPHPRHTPLTFPWLELGPVSTPKLMASEKNETIISLDQWFSTYNLGNPGDP